MENSELDYITVMNSILLLADYQPNMFKCVESGDRIEIKNAAVVSAKAASILKVPVVFTAIDPNGNGEFIKELTDIFPEKQVIIRFVPHFDAFEDKQILNLIRKSGRTKLIVAGLWTSVSFAYTAIHGIHEGLDVYGLIDAGGDATHDAHYYGVQKMLKAGVTPITWTSLISEWMNDCAKPGEFSDESYGKYDTMLSFLQKK